MSRRAISPKTISKQRAASDPNGSAWVSAHAGSGKTHVLTQRVVRLLLAHAPPSQILCLTYTKAAAANMSARIFGLLARWTTLDDAALAKEIEDMGEPTPSRVDLEHARRLFARAVETPGGLKIQTIHAFCEKLLHLFPFEANVPAGFRVVDEMGQAELLEVARRRALERAIQSPGPLRDAVARIARETKRKVFDELCREIVGMRDVLAEVHDRDDYARRLHACLGLQEDETLSRVEAEIIEDGEPPQAWRELGRLLLTGGKTDAKLGQLLLDAYALAPHPACLDPYFSAFFTGKGEPRGTKRGGIVTATLAKREPQLLLRMETERDRLIPLVDKRDAAIAAERALALATVADAILEEYARAKRYRGLFDYDDLIESARRLLHRSSPSWVLYKLDSQIDHILLDEAQDTSAAQWDILSAIADEFCAGAGRPQRRRGPPRSFFAVGDEKQSIFSFQGAAPEKFDEERRKFSRRFESAGKDFHWVQLVQSFRSAQGVLDTVDKVFAFGENGVGLSSDPAEPPPRHEACKQGVASLIEIWEPIGPQKAEESQDWQLPLDLKTPGDPTERLARMIARKIAALLAPENGECVEHNGALRSVTPGDILILVRKRGPLFEAINRALKSEHVPVAGADRLMLAEHIAVMDLVALGRAALLPQDDLNFATLLKSPLLGLTDDDLIALAPHRKGALHEALFASDDPRHRGIAARFDRWRRFAVTLSPFDFYSRILGPDGARSAIVARLGGEANDAVDEFLRLALNYEREEAPSLTTFLSMIEALHLSIKRDMETAGGAVRVMTAHAAKGLEAKIVFLPDTCGAPTGKHDPKLYAIGDDAPIVLWAGKDNPAAIEEARERRRTAEREEHQRLLYVALTRAEERLYISGCHGESGPQKGCWYDAIRDALEAECETAPHPFESDKAILRMGSAPHREDLAHAAQASAKKDIPAFARTPAPVEAVMQPPLRPSSALAGADTIAFDDNAPPTREAAERMLVGRLTHALLQYLPDCPVAKRAEAAKRFIELRGALIDEARRAAIVKAALALIADEKLADLFSGASAAEVDIVATLGSGLAISGRIDRLAVMERDVLVAEFKTGAPRPAPSHLRQLAIYREGVAQLYPGKRVRCFIVWTQNASVFEAGDSELDEALSLVRQSDGGVFER